MKSHLTFLFAIWRNLLGLQFFCTKCSWKRGEVSVIYFWKIYLMYNIVLQSSNVTCPSLEDNKTFSSANRVRMCIQRVFGAFLLFLLCSQLLGFFITKKTWNMCFTPVQVLQQDCRVTQGKLYDGWSRWPSK